MKTLPLFMTLIVFMGNISLLQSQELSKSEIKQISKESKRILKIKAINSISDYFMVISHLHDPGQIAKQTKIEIANAFFESNDTPVYDDLACNGFHPEFLAKEYFNCIETLYQKGVHFELKNLSIKKIVVSEDEVLVTALVKKMIKTPDQNTPVRHKLLYYFRFATVAGKPGKFNPYPKVFKITQYKKNEF